MSGVTMVPSRTGRTPEPHRRLPGPHRTPAGCQPRSGGIGARRRGYGAAMRRPARLLPLAAVAAAGLLGAACGSGGAGSAARTSASSHVAPPAPASTPAPGPSGSSGSSSAAGSTRCHASDLTVAHASNGAAAGSLSERVTFTNTSGATCTLTGYPGMQMLGAQGQHLTTTVHRGAASSVPPVPERTVTLAPGGTASFIAGWADATGYAGATCPTSTQVEITAPNDYTSNTIAWQITPYGGDIPHLQCGEIAVSPVYAGSGQPPA